VQVGQQPQLRLGLHLRFKQIGRIPHHPGDSLALEVVADIAMAETDSGVYFVGLYAPPDEYDTLHDAVLLPIVEARAPLE